jgi:manganese transport protein
MKRGTKSGDTKVVASAELVLEGRSQRWDLRQILPFMGPAFIASIAYIDPGNFATNIQGGAEFGYKLLWVVVASNLMAMLLQMLSAKLPPTSSSWASTTKRGSTPSCRSTP